MQCNAMPHFQLMRIASNIIYIAMHASVCLCVLYCLHTLLLNWCLRVQYLYLFLSLSLSLLMYVCVRVQLYMQLPAAIAVNRHTFVSFIKCLEKKYSYPLMVHVSGKRNESHANKANWEKKNESGLHRMHRIKKKFFLNVFFCG